MNLYTSRNGKKNGKTFKCVPLQVFSIENGMPEACLFLPAMLTGLVSIN